MTLKRDLYSQAGKYKLVNRSLAWGSDSKRVTCQGRSLGKLTVKVFLEVLEGPRPVVVLEPDHLPDALGVVVRQPLDHDRLLGPARPHLDPFQL